MIGFLEIIMSLIVFIIIWFVIFKIKLMMDKRVNVEKVLKRLDKQQIKTAVLDGKQVNLADNIRANLKEEEKVESKKKENKEEEKKKEIKKKKDLEELKERQKQIEKLQKEMNKLTKNDTNRNK